MKDLFSKVKIAKNFRKEKEINNGNRIILIHKDGTEQAVNSLDNISIKYYGQNSLIKIYDDYKVSHLNLSVGEGAYLEFGRNFTVRFPFNIDTKSGNGTVIIGDNACIGTGSILAGDEDNLEVIIGDNFLSATNLYIRNSDGHTIYDLDTKKPINTPNFGVHIGNNVWCGYNVSIIKDAIIPNNCIIGAGSVVGKREFSENSIIAGVPAKIIRTGVMWDSRTITKYRPLLNSAETGAAETYSEREKEYFNDNFFVISSDDSLENIENRLYGYAIDDNKFFINAHNCNFKFSENCSGCYVNVASDPIYIYIYQDYFGSYGLYLYKTHDYFAISNSFLYLVNFLSDKKEMTFDEIFAKAFLAPPTAVLSYSDTMIKEITLLPRNCFVKIDKQKKNVEVEYFDLQETRVNIDTKKAIDLLDSWHKKWNRIIRGLVKADKYIQCDLSGGKDSRASFSTLFKQDVDLNKIEIVCSKGTTPTANDDYAISKQISEIFKYSLNEEHGKKHRYSIDPEENYNASLLTKGGFHKELMFSYFYNENPLFRITGCVADLRDFWAESVDEFIFNNCNNVKINSVDCKRSLGILMHKSKELAEKSLKGGNHTAKDYFYRNIRARHQYGRAQAEAFLGNQIFLSPLLDPILYKINQDIGRENDYDLLYALIYDRYLPEINGINFDGGRIIDEQSKRIAHEINLKYPFVDTEDADESPIEIVYERKKPNISRKSKRAVELLTESFYSEEVRDFTQSFFGKEVYEQADEYYRIAKHHSYIQTACIVQIYLIYKLAAKSRNKNIPSLKDKNYFIPKLYSNNGYIKEVIDIINAARLDIKNKGEKTNEVSIDFCSDHELFTENPNWWSDNEGKGLVVQSTKGKLELRIRCKGIGKLEVYLKGPYLKDGLGNVVSVKTDYLKVTLKDCLTDEIVFDSTGIITTDSNHSKKIEVNCQDGQSFSVNIEWTPYAYSKNELFDLMDVLFSKPISFFEFWKNK